ncbi:methylmalonyl Co-A mutase-associated GTPase MeaB [Amycolatopsis rubida]|uniref:LAO/AO transport system kinase n=1 Tax=Amycolatopsis rubida TaxID=112413 RepID=A0A1I5N453_9PSEU|nr:MULTISPECIES: methylmalonyl Co-A mutase-associated GTPase MeaB [Amycolatopsis]MYW92787.1 methylmalonyl Co-A mutase-associated GTPase MeaB [Amycolatopsis rubida]NEC57773.1 methylmalonyl Co-A mutase-associated GTPase MeaB [Amycolatopsis rubida]OAP21292.1 putative GTPase [Amycolatopsis sp. M39]SFP16021.1 LAO/AO transport system kinase [Amycolatopsis rubida]
MAGPDLDELVARAREGQPRAVARLISLVEDSSPRVADIARALTPYTGRARVAGLTGPPGVGKSTSTSALLTALRGEGLRVGVLAIDPSSPFSGGALLGDRIRMTEHATDPGVFIRSMATRGHLGGLSWATPQAVRVLDAAGFDVVLIETVGVGQSEVDVVKLADTTVVLLAPGMGDGIQAAKAGVLEIADVFVVNKADRDGADATVHDLKQMITLARRELRGPSWRQPIVRTVAAKGEGVDEVVSALRTHYEWLVAHGELDRRRAARAREEVAAIALRRLHAELADLRDGDRLGDLAARVAARELDPFTAADRLIAELKGS